MLQELQQLHTWDFAEKYDWVYLANPDSASEPRCVNLPCGKASAFLTDLWAMFETPVANRQDLLTALRDNYPTERVHDYLATVAEKNFEDLPGKELATVIVQHEETNRLFFVIGLPKPTYLAASVCSRLKARSALIYT